MGDSGVVGGAVWVGAVACGWAGDAGAGDGLAGVVGEAAADAAGVDEGPAEPVSARAWSMTA